MSSPRGTLQSSLPLWRPAPFSSSRVTGRRAPSPLSRLWNCGWLPAAKNVIGNQRHIPDCYVSWTAKVIVNRINFVSMDPFIAAAVMIMLTVVLCQKGSRRRRYQ